MTDTATTLMWEWATHNAHRLSDDLDAFCHWWSWRIDFTDEAERVAYEAWKYDQMKDRPVAAPSIMAARKPSRTAVAALAMAEAMGQPMWVARRTVECSHRFGLAGGFSECSACGVKREART